MGNIFMVRQSSHKVNFGVKETVVVKSVEGFSYGILNIKKYT